MWIAIDISDRWWNITRIFQALTVNTWWELDKNATGCFEQIPEATPKSSDSSFYEKNTYK